VTVRERSGPAPDDVVVARLQALAPHLDGEPDPAFRAATRARLVAMAAVRTPEPAPVSPLRRLLSARASDAAPARWRTRLTAGLAGAALGVTAVAALVAVAADAGPGDLLYDVKRGTEQTQLALAGDSRGQTLLDLASTRLEELQGLAGADAGLVISTLETMDHQTTEGTSWLTARAVDTGDGGALGVLGDWSARQSAGLAAIRGDVPQAATDDVDDSLALLSGITDRVAALRTALECAGGPATDGSDELGPVPAACPAGTPAPPPSGGTTTAPPGSGRATAPPGSDSATAPPVSPPAVPPTGGTPGGASGTPGTGGLPPPGVPTIPSVPGLPKRPPTNGSTPTLPSLPPLPSIPSLRLPSLPLLGANAGGGQPASPPSPRIDIDLNLCLPPLATIGDC
jgi:hypothetical protein